MTDPRSWLFVPADDGRKVEKALASEADAVILDLEDSVTDNRKLEARECIRTLLPKRTGEGPQRWVRVNPLDGEHYRADLAACEHGDLDGLVLPKAESGADVARLAADIATAGWRIHAIVTETPASLFGLLSYRHSSPALAAMSWGAEDLSTALGAASKHDASGELSFTCRLARSLCLAGAVAAGAQPVDGVFADFRDGESLRRETEASAREGFTGKLAIHPAQVPIINAAFTPSADDVARAREIVAAFAAQPDAGVLSVGGKMVDRPHLVQARRVLERAS